MFAESLLLQRRRAGQTSNLPHKCLLDFAGPIHRPAVQLLACTRYQPGHATAGNLLTSAPQGER